jgi:hypothetical protein
MEDGKKHKVPRSQRRCTFCTHGERDDELHLLQCPAWNDLRLRWLNSEEVSRLASISDGAIKNFMNGCGCAAGSRHSFWHRLARLLVAINTRRNTHDDSDSERTPPDDSPGATQ